MSSDEQPIIFHNHNGSLSPVNDDVEGNYLPSDSPTDADDNATPTTSSPTHWIKKNYLSITLASLVLTTIIVASVVFRPGGPGNLQNNKINSQGLAAIAATTRGKEIMGPTYYPTYYPTYVPTYTPTSGGAVEEEVDVPETIVPTPTPTAATPIIITSFPTMAPVTTKPTFSPNFWGLFTPPTAVPTAAPVTSLPTDAPVTALPTDVPTDVSTVQEEVEVTTYSPTKSPTTVRPTYVPTVEVTGQNSETVSTEVTGPPTTASRNP